uniref:Uncharacterized protein n=1 Tax=Haptolina brevifila TaxID=156173 RepID=A0A7S2D1Y9_9EUKA
MPLAHGNGSAAVHMPWDIQRGRGLLLCGMVFVMRSRMLRTAMLKAVRRAACTMAMIRFHAPRIERNRASAASSAEPPVAAALEGAAREKARNPCSKPCLERTRRWKPGTVSQ